MRELRGRRGRKEARRDSMEGRGMLSELRAEEEMTLTRVWTRSTAGHVQAGLVLGQLRSLPALGGPGSRQPWLRWPLGRQRAHSWACLGPPIPG